MTELIFHHYQNSPFSQKIRLILGYKKLAWKSVTVPNIMPKPDVVALTGGYRRTPVLQIGADVYCDTALIADVLERVAPEPTLYPAMSEGVSRTLAQWADFNFFWCSIGNSFQPAGNVSSTSCPTFRRTWIERPRSPCTAWPSQIAYCSGNGRSKPMSRRACSISARVALGGMDIAAGSTGNSRNAVNSKADTTSRIGPTVSRRRLNVANRIMKS